jgi:hypothetical protein
VVTLTKEERASLRRIAKAQGAVDVDDAVQEVEVRLLSYPPPIGTPPLAWATGILSNVIDDAKRKTARASRDHGQLTYFEKHRVRTHRAEGTPTVTLGALRDAAIRVLVDAMLEAAPEVGATRRFAKRSLRLEILMKHPRNLGAARHQFSVARFVVHTYDRAPFLRWIKHEGEPRWPRPVELAALAVLHGYFAPADRPLGTPGQILSDVAAALERERKCVGMKRRLVALPPDAPKGVAPPRRPRPKKIDR